MKRPTYTLTPEALKRYYTVACALCGSKRVELETIGGEGRVPHQQQSGQIIFRCLDCENPKARIVV